MNAKATCFCIFFTFAAAACAQQQQSDGSVYSLQVKSQIVALDVVVTDKQGNIVRGLTKDSFKVYEDQTPEVIRSVDQPGAQSIAPNLPIRSTHELDRLAPEAAVSILVLDEISTRFEDQAFARYSIQQYLKAQGDELKQPVMLVAAGPLHFAVLRDYTTSRGDILHALDHHYAEMPAGGMGGISRQQQFNQAFASLFAIAQATAGHPGHKNMIWIGRGFTSVKTDTADTGAFSLKAAVQRCTNMLRDARVTLYTVDPQGVSTNGVTIGSRIAEAERQTVNDAGGPGFSVGSDPMDGPIDFDTMAHETGGQTFRGRNDVDALIGESLRDGTEFYTLTYTPAVISDASQSFRHIRVVMNAPGLHATARAGYYPRRTALGEKSSAPVATKEPAPTPAATRHQLFDFSVAAQNQLIYDGIPMTVARDESAPDHFKLTVLNKDIPWQSAEDGKQTATFTVLILSYDRKNKLLNRAANELTVVAGKPSGTTVLPAAIATAAPAARVRIVVRDNSTGKLAAENYPLAAR